MIIPTIVIMIVDSRYFFESTIREGLQPSSRYTLSVKEE
jgi:hypothetical protein